MLVRADGDFRAIEFIALPTEYLQHHALETVVTAARPCRRLHYIGPEEAKAYKAHHLLASNGSYRSTATP